MFVVDPPMVPRGYRVTLTCTITAQPMANSSEIVRIMDNGDQIVLANQTDDVGIREFIVTYILENPAFPEDDGAVFQCRTTNDNGLAVENVMLVVQGELSKYNYCYYYSILDERFFLNDLKWNTFCRRFD